MTELLAALLGAIVGGLLSAGVGAWQTSKVLKHETDMAAAERREAEVVEEARRQSTAADQLVTALAEYITITADTRDRAVHFVRMMATEDVHRDRDRRTSALMQAGASYAHALPEQVRERWTALIWMVRFCAKEQPKRAENHRLRDYNDLLNYAEYVRQSLYAVSEDYPMPPEFPAPEVRRRMESRVWGYQPEKGTKEPDLTDWQLSSRLVGEVTFANGEVRWYGPNGVIEELSRQEPEENQQP